MRGRHVIIVVAVAPPLPGIVVHVPIVHLVVVVRVADGGLVLRQRGGRFGLDAIGVGVVVLVEGVEVLVLEGVLLGGQEGL